MTTTIENLTLTDSAASHDITGQYELQPGVVFTVTNEDGAIMLDAPDGSRFELLQSSGTEYFIDTMNSQVTFHTGDNGSVTGVKIHLRDRDLEARKIE